MTPIIKYRILIVDDNPFPTRECCGILLEKLQNHFGKAFDHTLQEYYCNDYNDLQNDYPNIRGKDFHFVMEAEVSLSIYNYDPTKTKEINQNNIIEIINDRKINIFWTDRGHTNFRINGGKMFEEINGFPAKADELYMNKNIVQRLKTNGIRQVAMYSYNPKFTYTAIDNKVEEIGKIFQGVMSKDDIYVLETSPILNLFSLEHKLYNGLPETELLGTLNAYKYYGKLLGIVLFDLFLQIRENKAKLSDRQKRYNFFNRYNRNFLRYFKLLNSDLINKLNGFKVGMVSFYGNIYGQEHFLIDVPYKEYYEQYDTELHKGNPAIGTILDPIETDTILDSKKWLHFKYKKNGDEHFIGCYELEESIKSREHLVECYLPLLHTGVFYEPEFYENANFPFDRFKITTKDDFCLDAGNSCVEIVYLFKKVSFEGIQGVSHFVVWRRVSPESESINLKETIEEIWENYYRLVEPKLEAALVTILQIETAKQAIRAAISQVMARNMSHNIGSHVMNKLIDAGYLEKFCSYSNCLKSYKPNSDFKDAIDHRAFKQLAIYNNYVKCRMDYLSDMSFGTPLMQTSKNMFEDVFRPLDKVRLLLENISGLSNFEYNIQFKKGNDPLSERNDFPLAIPNDVLGNQALYNIIENVVRNTAKHTEKPDSFLTEFTVRFKDISQHQLAILDEATRQQAQSLMCVEIFDNINLSNKALKEIVLGNDLELDNFFLDIRIAINETSYALPYIDWLLYQQNNKINQSILSENNQLRASSLGLIEMEASAAYLRKIDLNLIDDDDYEVTYNNRLTNSNGKLNVLKAVRIFNGAECYLGYRFFMLKPQEVLIVSDIFKEEENLSKTGELRNHGIWLITKDEFLKHLLDNNGVYNHQFVVHDDLDNLEIEVKEQAEKVKAIKYFKTSLSLRILKISQNEISELAIKEAKEIMEECWERWDTENYRTLPVVENRYSVFLNHNPDMEFQKAVTSNTYFYIDCLSSNAQSKLPGFSGNLTDYLFDIVSQNSTIRKQIGESIKTKILVIDERIQESLTKEHLKGVSIGELFDQIGIEVPYKINSVNLSESSFKKEISEKIIEVIENYILKSKNAVSFNQVNSERDFVLIHYSILERMFNGSADRSLTISEYLIKWSNQINIIVTSGRGTPEGLPKNVRFINLSSVLYAFTELKSKYFINYILHSSRKSNRPSHE